MRIGYFDLTSGVSGDMLISAMCHKAVPHEYFLDEISKIKMRSSIEISFSDKKKQSILGKHLDVKFEGSTERHLKDIFEIIDNSELSNFVKKLSKKIFRLIGKAEAQVHGADINHIHFHEVGAEDSIIDIIGFAICLDYLKLDKIIATPINTGFGKVKCAHGILPVPAPATIELLSGIPCKGGDVEGELSTPTGVANIVSCVDEYSKALPELIIESSGNGIGTYDYPGTSPLRFVVGTLVEDSHKKLYQVETNIDDCSPEIIAHVCELLIDNGVNDVTSIPAFMKKGRVGHNLKILTDKKKLDRVANILLTETTTIGLRYFPVERIIADRSIEELKTPFGSLKVKSVNKGGKRIFYPEFEDARLLSRETGHPLIDIYDYVKDVSNS